MLEQQAGQQVPTETKGDYNSSLQFSNKSSKIRKIFQFGQAEAQSLLRKGHERQSNLQLEFIFYLRNENVTNQALQLASNAMDAVTEVYIKLQKLAQKLAQKSLIIFHNT